MIARLGICSIFAPENYRNHPMKLYMTSVLAAMFAMLSCSSASAQEYMHDVFNPISKYLAKGDSDKHSALFSDNL